MASSSKRQTTMAKIQREQAVREKRARKAEKREARLAAPAVPEAPLELLDAPVPLAADSAEIDAPDGAPVA